MYSVYDEVDGHLVKNICQFSEDLCRACARRHTHSHTQRKTWFSLVSPLQRLYHNSINLSPSISISSPTLRHMYHCNQSVVKSFLITKMSPKSKLYQDRNQKKKKQKSHAKARKLTFHTACASQCVEKFVTGPVADSMAKR